MLFAVAAQGQFEIDQMDATTALLQGDIDEKIYMRQPDMFDDGSGRVCLLKKSIYGLKQASRQWNTQMKNALKRRLSYSFEMKDLGEASSCVGIQVTRDRHVGNIFEPV